MPDLNTDGDREVTLRFNVRNALIWSTVVAGALWADLIIGTGLFGLYSQWVAHRMYLVAPSVTFSVGLSLPLFLLFFTVAAVWVTLTVVGARSQPSSEAWAGHRTLAVSVVLAAGLLFLMAVWTELHVTGSSFSLADLVSIVPSLLLIADGAVAARGIVRFYQRSRV